jgi:hypothetical protein
MRASLRPLLALLVLFAAPAWAVELELGWDARTGWDSNPLRSENDEESDFSFYVGPNLGLSERKGRYDFLVYYRPRYEQYVDLSSVNGFEHFARGHVHYRVSPRTDLTVSHDFSRTRGLGIDFIEPVPGIDPVDAVAELRFRRSPTLKNSSKATLVHRLTPLWSVESNFDAVLYDYEDEFRSPVQSLRGSAQLTRPLTPLLVAGFGSAVTRQNFDESEISVGNGTTIFEAYAVARYQISPTLDLSFAGGPAWSQPDEANDTSKTRPHGLLSLPGGTLLMDPTDCAPGSGPNGTISRSECLRTALQLPIASNTPVDPGRMDFTEVDVLGDIEDPDGSVTFFGRAALNKQWRNFNGALSYERRASTSSGLGSTNLDLALAMLTWLPDRRRWRFDARATWTRQTNATELPLTDELLSPTPITVYVDSRGRVFEQPVPGAIVIPNASRVVGVRNTGFQDSGVETESWRFDLRATCRFDENWLATASAGWIRQESTGDFQEPTTIDNLRFQLGFTWTLDPIEL